MVLVNFLIPSEDSRIYKLVVGKISENDIFLTFLI